ncbi:MAG: alpha/beta hydrolase [Pseudomonadota bacterium]
MRQIVLKLMAWLMKLAVMLPTSWKIWLSGGKPLVLGGRTLDPDLQLLTYLAARQPPVHSMAPEDAQAKVAEAEKMLATRPEPGVSWRDFEINSRASHMIPVRLYRPGDQNPAAPMMAYFHMGGGVIGNVDTSHAMCGILCRVLRCPIVSIDYRLAPQHKFPAGLEDCLDGYEWALKNAESLGAPAARATVGGSSMGGGFSAIIAQETRRQGIPMPDLQLLIYPGTHVTADFPSHEIYGETYPLDRKTVEWFMDLYLPEGTDKEDVLLQPAIEPRLEGLPPAIIATAGFDPLVDDGEAYAKKLRDAGVDVVYKCYDSLAHGFVGFTAVSPASRAACLDIAYLTAKAYTKLEAT